MNEKERIIELVKNNVISMEEALDLLEAASAQPKTKEESIVEEDVVEQTSINEEEPSHDTTDDFNKAIHEVVKESKVFAKDLKKYIKSQVEGHPQADESEEVRETAQEKQAKREALREINQELVGLKEEFDRRNEALTIAKQRLREIEIFEELEDLTPEMTTQKSSLIDKQAQIEDKLAALQDKIDSLSERKQELEGSSQTRSDLKDFFTTSSEKITEAATQIGKDASKEGKKWGAFLAGQSKSFLENFNLKDVNVNLQVPWVKTVDETYELVYDAPDELTIIEFDIYSGDVKVTPYDGTQILVEASVGFHGKHEVVSQEAFLEGNTVGILDDRFVMKINSPKFSVDANVKVPNKMYDAIRINMLNGDLKMKDLETSSIELKNKNGDIKLKQLTAQELSVELLNGDISIVNAAIETQVINNLNGDIRISGPITNLSAETVNSDLYLTKLNPEDAHIKVKSVSGDIKFALPRSLNLTMDAKTSLGEIKERMTDVERMDGSESRSKAKFHRIVSESTTNAQVELTTTTGDIYLKDSKE